MLKFQNKYQKQIDRKLIRAFTSNNEKNALNELFKRYTHLVASIALGILKNEQKAKHAVLDIFKSIIIDLKNNDIRNFNAWVYNVTTRHCFKVKNMEDGLEYKDDFDEILEKNLLLRNQSQIFKRAIQQLNTHQKTCVNFFYFKGLSYFEITERTGFSIREVRSHIQNSKKKLELLIYNNERE